MIRNSDIDRLRGLFAKRLIATMDMLKKTVGTVADLTVFRKLRELDYCTSYSHRGRFYTLRELAEFDENGLWWIRSVGFSSRGTLVATAEGLVNASEAGYAVEELDAIVRVGTKDVLPKLAWEKRLRRTRIRNRNVYFSPKRSIPRMRTYSFADPRGALSLPRPKEWRGVDRLETPSPQARRSCPRAPLADEDRP